MKIRKANKIVIDTNIWISFLVGKHIARMEDIIFEHDLNILYSEELLDEIMSVINRPKFRKYFEETELNLIEEIFKTVGNKINVKSKINICRDEKDNFLLSLCKEGKADFLITGDDDLLSLKKFESAQIVNYKNFVELFS